MKAKTKNRNKARNEKARTPLKATKTCNSPQTSLRRFKNPSKTARKRAEANTKNRNKASYMRAKDHLAKTKPQRIINKALRKVSHKLKEELRLLEAFHDSFKRRSLRLREVNLRACPTP